MIDLDDHRRADRMSRWPAVYRCLWCEGRGQYARATLRVFSGVSGYHAGGWPACDEHANLAIDKALQAMLSRYAGPDFRVDAIRVEPDEEGWPTLTGRMFSARRKAP